MRDFNNNNRRSGGGGRSGGFGGNRGGGRSGGFGGGRDRDSGPREMYETVCTQCGKNCQVPFRPTGEKPVYCSECFEGKENRNDRFSGNRRSGGGGAPRRSDNSGADTSKILSELSSLSAKIDNLVSVLTPKVVEEKPKARAKKAEVEPSEVVPSEVDQTVEETPTK